MNTVWSVYEWETDYDGLKEKVGEFKIEKIKDMPTPIENHYTVMFTYMATDIWLTRVSR